MEFFKHILQMLFFFAIAIIIGGYRVKAATCASGTGLNSTGSCVACSVSFCIQCTTNYTFCTSCNNVHGAKNGTCVPCADPQCIWCWSNYSNCAMCGSYYGLTNGYNTPCIKCLDSFCLYCGSNYSACSACISGYVLVNLTCTPCFTTCLTCQTSTTNCTSCIQGYYLSNNTCVKCSPNCSTCTNATSCQNCAVRYFSPVANICYICPLVCTTCIFNASLSMTPQCLLCVVDHINPPLCPQICGDSKTNVYECDKELGNLWDGCNDNCLIQIGFRCQITQYNQQNGTICSYFLQMEITFVSFNRMITENNFFMQLHIYPPLHIFKTASSEQLIQIFSLLNQNIIVKQIQYSSDDSILKIHAEFTDDLIKIINIQVSQHPGTKIESIKQYQITIQISNQKVFYYSQFVKKIYIISIIFSSILTGLGWISMIFGLILKRLAGLQAMIILQFSWLPLLWLNSDLHPSFKSMYPLKFTYGYSNQFSIQNSVQSISFPYNSYFGINSTLLINNFNLSLLFSVIAAGAVVVNLIKLGTILIHLVMDGSELAIQFLKQM